MSLFNLFLMLKGGTGSGNWGHTGRPGKRGGSGFGGGFSAIGATSGMKIEEIRILSKDYRKVRTESGIRKKVAKEWLSRIEYGHKNFSMYRSDAGSKGLKDPHPNDLDQMSDWLARHDPLVMGHPGLRSVIMAHGPKAFDSLWEQLGDGSSKARNVAAFYVPREGRLVLRRGFTANNQANFDHEVGHAVFQKSNFTGEWNRNYRNNKNFDRHTKYAKTSIEEGFSESYMSYIDTEGKTVNPKIKETYSKVETVIQGMDNDLDH